MQKPLVIWLGYILSNLSLVCKKLSKKINTFQISIKYNFTAIFYSKKWQSYNSKNARKRPKMTYLILALKKQARKVW